MNVPKLRFKEFNDEWKHRKIKDVAKVIGGGTPSTDENKYWSNEINWFTPSEIGKTKYVSSSQRKISLDGLNNSSAKLLPKGSILLSSRATVGEASILLEEASTNQGFQSLIINKNNDNEFIYYMKEIYKREMLKKAFGSTFLEISKSNVENLNIIIPPLKEQTKIANFLSLLDKKIELQSKKIEDLKLFKLYLRNKLLKEHQNKKIRLKDLVKCESSTITLNDIENDCGLYPIYGANGIIKNISKYNFENEYIAIIKDGAGVGRTLLCNGKSSILATMNALIPKNKYPINYICEQINKIKFEKYIVGSGIPHIYFRDYGGEDLSVHSIEVANKIDVGFKNFDKKLKLSSSKLEKLNELKKGLMQSMFV